MHARTSRIALCAALALAGAATHAMADSAAAEKLFRDGKAAMKEGKIAEACDAFQASENNEHNLATVMSLADCREKNGQYASAWALFLQADSQTRSDATKSQLNAVAKKRAAALETRLSYLTINVPDEARIEGLVITRDGTPVDAGAWNRAIPVDGGDHLIAGHAPGHEEWSTKISVEPENDKKAVEVPKFKELPKLVNPPPGTEPVPLEPDMWTPRRKIAAYVLGGAAAAGAVAAGFGFSANSLRNQALSACPPNTCNQDNAAHANELNDRARSRALVANIGLGVAGAAAVTAVVLWVTGGPDTAESADKPEPADTALHVVPIFGGDTNGFALTRSF
jgi:tetratricopeptide (TPR) repeat protein